MQNRELSVIQGWIEVKKLSRASVATGKFLKVNIIYSRLINAEVFGDNI